MIDNDNTFDFLVEYLTSKVVEKSVKEHNLPVAEAMNEFLNSETFEKLCNPHTYMYIEGPAYIYDVYAYERTNGTIRDLTA